MPAWESELILCNNFFMQPESETTVEQDSLFEGFSADDKGKINSSESRGETPHKSEATHN